MLLIHLVICVVYGLKSWSIKRLTRDAWSSIDWLSDQNSWPRLIDWLIKKIDWLITCLMLMDHMHGHLDWWFLDWLLAWLLDWLNACLLAWLLDWLLEWWTYISEYHIRWLYNMRMIEATIRVSTIWWYRWIQSSKSNDEMMKRTNTTSNRWTNQMIWKR